MGTTRNVMLVMCCLLYGTTFAQDSKQGWLVDTMYNSGKINSVIAVVAVLIAGLATWMFLMDRKIRRMERELDRH